MELLNSRSANVKQKRVQMLKSVTETIKHWQRGEQGRLLGTECMA